MSTYFHNVRFIILIGVQVLFVAEGSQDSNLNVNENNGESEKEITDGAFNSKLGKINKNNQINDPIIWVSEIVWNYGNYRYFRDLILVLFYSRT